MQNNIELTTPYHSHNTFDQLETPMVMLMAQEPWTFTIPKNKAT
jgi:hypothetical protein